MRILIAPVDMAGQAGLLAKNLNGIDYQVTLCTYNRNPFGHYRQLQLSRPEMKKWFSEHWNEFDVFHYYWGLTIYNDGSDLDQLIHQHKKVLMRHCGNDVRIRSAARKNNPYIRILYRNGQTEEQVVNHLKILSRRIRDAVVPDYELYEHAKLFYEKVHVVPRMIQTQSFRPRFPDEKNDRPLVVHAPSLPFFKGSGDVIDTVKELQRRYDFDFQLVKNLPQRKALKIYSRADIIIDQLLIGTYGVLAVEAMALGKPVISYLREDLKSTFLTDPPIVSANPATLYEQLEWLITHPAERRRLGISGRKYVEDMHDVRKVVPQMIRVYKQLPPL
ncbi:glycosyltransferase family 4 protein [Paludifilum halophilum]|nr:glycosyltransferase family 4 protein [Paludifilum halophilum]